MLSVQYPGRQDRGAEKCAEAISELADEIGPQLSKWTDVPLALLGHGMGAIVAFELARQLELSASAPVVLFVSGSVAPHKHRQSHVHLLDDNGIVDELRELSGGDLVDAVDRDLISANMDAIRGDYKSIGTYSYGPGPTLSCPIVALAGDSDTTVTLSDVRAWNELSTGEFEFQIFPGGSYVISDSEREFADAVFDRLVLRAAP
ncbi:surfactin synthase thioesterase subunit [Kutzneria kofuensis]|uniref:Surfactin synthase thioesterase subunit n=1 Tax=Kutzneria kofuensis TaxID=103725 RepID=A0A7W9NG56_9PSEU|nr:surfactin synthase thioesterase subunit [Kutzneria kofuensis]